MKNSEFENEGVNSAPKLQLIPLVKASGGTCNAYMARLFGKKVFVKEIKPEFADDARMLAAFRKEAEIGFRLEHRHLPRYIYAEGVLPPERYIVQEFIDGLTLSDFIKDNPVYFRNKQSLKRFVRELADVIDYLHLNGIVHLDLKPENIIITRVGHTLKLVDLGFCASDFYDDTRGLTRSELAPEGISEPRNRGVKSDYYGIGTILRYIRSHTRGLSGHEFRKLESLLLHPDSTKRLSSKEDIEKILARNVRVGKIWFASAMTLIVAALVLFIIVRVGITDRHDAPHDERAENHNSQEVKEAVTNYTEKEGNSTESIGVDASKESLRVSPNTVGIREENLSPQTTESNTPATPLKSEFPYKSYERLKAEMAENINRNFASFEKMLTAYVRDGKYTKKDYKTLFDAYAAALHKTFNTDPYKAKYKDLSPSLIDDTMAEMQEKIEKANWGPAFEKYIHEYETSESGSN